MASGLCLSALVLVSAIVQGYCQCDQNFIFPAGSFPQIPDDVDYNASLCFDCSADDFKLEAMGNPQAPVDMNTSLVMISTTLVPMRYVLVIPDPRAAFGSGSATIVCSGNSFRISELVFNPPTLTPSGTTSVVEGANVPLACSSNLNDLTVTWTRGSTQLAMASSTSSLTHTINNIMRGDTGSYTCRVVTTIGTNAFSVARESTVMIDVQYPTEATLSNTNSTKKMGEELMVSCTVDGNPAPTVTWWFNETMLDTTPSRITAGMNGNVATLTITSLMGNDTGNYTCRASNGVGSPAVSEPLALTVQVPPDPVGTLQAGAITTDSIPLTWVLGFDGREDIDTVNVSYVAVSNNDSPSEGVVSLAGLATSHTLAGLQPLTNYNITVIAINDVGPSPGMTITVETLPLVPNKPTILSVVADSSTQLTVNWMNPTRNTFTQTEYTMFRLEYDSDSNFPSPITVIDMASITTYTTPANLNKGTVYYFRVAIRNSADFSETSDIVSGRTAIDPPTSVQGLILTPYPDTVCVIWNAPSDNGGQTINRYLVEWASVTTPDDDSSTPTNMSSMPVIGEFMNTNISATTYLITGLTESTEYIVRVSAGNMEAGLGQQVQRNVTTGAPIPVHPTARLRVTAGSITAVSVSLEWDTVTPVTGYMLQYRPATQPSWSDARSLSTSTTMQSPQGLESSTAYVARVIILNNCSQQVTPDVTFTTLELDVSAQSMSFANLVIVPYQARNATLQCLLSTGQPAPDVVWMRDGPLDIPANSRGRNESTLIIFNLTTADSGNYTCTSRNMASSTLEMIVQGEPPTDSTSEGLPIYAIIIIAVLAAVFIVIFIIVLIIVVIVCCRRGDDSGSKPAYRLQNLDRKASGGWIDEGAGGFVPSTMQSGTYKPTGGLDDDDVDAPVVRGRTHTQDQYTAATFTRKDTMDATNPTSHSDV